MRLAPRRPHGLTEMGKKGGGIAVGGKPGLTDPIELATAAGLGSAGALVGVIGQETRVCRVVLRRSREL